MKKIISLFQRNYDGDRLVRNEVTPGAEWVIAHMGVPTRKWDGTCCMVRDGKLYKRYEIKQGGKAPVGFEPANDVDPETGKQQGWVPVGDGPEDRYHREAFDAGVNVGAADMIIGTEHPPSDGTYELCGPKVQGNPEHLHQHILIPHGHCILSGVPRDFDGIRDYLATHDIEGIVWHRDNGDMVKIKGKDLGIKRPTKRKEEQS